MKYVLAAVLLTATAAGAQERDPGFVPGRPPVASDLVQPPDPLDAKRTQGALRNLMTGLGQGSSALIDKATGQPFTLTDQQRSLIVKAMEQVDSTENLAIYHDSLDHIKRGEQLTLGDVVFLNRPLMFAQQPKYGMTPEQIAEIKDLLRRLRASASGMVSTK